MRSLRVATFLRGRLLAGGLLAGAAGVACSTGNEDDGTVAISHQSAALLAQSNAEAALRGALNAGGFLAESHALAEGLSSLGGSTSECASDSTGSLCAAGDTTCSDVIETCETTDSDVTSEDLLEARQELHEELDEFMRVVREELLIEDNLESDDGATSVYRLPQSFVCPDEAGGTDSTSGSVAPGVEPSEPEPVAPTEPCSTYTELQPRLRLSSPSDGNVDVELLLTEGRHSPVTLQLYSDRMGVLLDLSELKSVADSVDEELEGLETLEGQIQWQLVKNAELDFSLTVGFLSDLHVKAALDEGPVEVLVSAASPAAELRLDGNAKTITGSYDMRAINVLAPLASFMGSPEDSSTDPGAADPGAVEPGPGLVEEAPAPTYTGLIDILLGGYSGGLEFDGNTDVLRFTDLGLGDVTTTVKHEGNTLLALDVNPDSGRRFDLTVADTEQGTQLTFDPTLDVRLLLNFAHIADQVADIDAPLLDDQLRLWFEGDSPSLEVLEGQVRVLSGTMHAESSAAPESSVTVEAGMCLLDPGEVESPVSLIQALEAGVCQ